MINEEEGKKIEAIILLSHGEGPSSQTITDSLHSILDVVVAFAVNFPVGSVAQGRGIQALAAVGAVETPLVP